ncbi:MAG: ABC transporter ATP-binding protein [Cardiobacteriaceae bacterium]|nr:ABC transporter ATP-binding protein [Cardiobacteriaceae bacterium]
MVDLFTLHQLSVQAGAKRLLEIPKLSIPQHQLVALIGSNGAGKSTLLHALLGHVPNARLQGDIHCLGDKVINCLNQGKIAWVGQHEQFSLPLSALEYALLGVSKRLAWYQTHASADETKALALFEHFELKALAHKRVSSLSGGERQRLAIIRALMQDSPVLLLDEPSNHLDIRHERQLFAYLKYLVEEQGKSIVVVLHNLSHAHRHADTLIALHDGKLLACGSADEVLTDSNLQTMYQTTIYRHHTHQGTLYS